MRLIGLVLVLSLSAFDVVGAQGPGGGGLRVGAARVDITPAAEPGGPPATYAHERLYVRAVVIDNGSTRAVLIGADQGNMPEPVWDAASKAIAADLNVPVAHILMSATHTHSSSLTPPGARGAVPPAPAAAAVPPALVAPMLQAVRQARAALQPARVGFGTGSSWLNVNRDAIDDETRQWTQAPNLQGHSGPLREGTVPSRVAEATTRDRLLRWIESQGMLLGEETIRVMTSITSMDASPRIAGAQQMITCPGRTRTDGGREGRPGPSSAG